MPTETKPPRTYGCMDRNCMFGTPPGQHTNAGCRCNHPRTPEDRAQLRENVIAAIERAREEGVREGMRKFGFQEGQRWGLETAIEHLRTVTVNLEEWAKPLRPLPSPPPKDEPDHPAAGGEGLEPNEEGDR